MINIRPNRPFAALSHGQTHTALADAIKRYREAAPLLSGTSPDSQKKVFELQNEITHLHHHHEVAVSRLPRIKRHDHKKPPGYLK